MRRRRRRSGRPNPQMRLILLGLGGVLLVGGFFVLLNLADGAAPERQETRIELPNAFKD